MADDVHCGIMQLPAPCRRKAGICLTDLLLLLLRAAAEPQLSTRLKRRPHSHSSLLRAACCSYMLEGISASARGFLVQEES